MRENLADRVFGFLTVISYHGKNRQRNSLWRCRCVCGQERICRGADLKNRPNASCGCQQPRLAREANLTHGKRHTSEYNLWINVRARCRNPKHPRYANYGGRGITVCDRWRSSFENFLADVGAKPSANHTLERIDNNASYCPGNCRWATYPEQGSNTRLNRRITHEGTTSVSAVPLAIK